MIVKNHLKYKVGDRVFHKELGWGVVRGVANGFSSSRYAVEFDEEFAEAYDCDGLCDKERGSWVFERNLLDSDSLLSYLCHDIKEEIEDIRVQWRTLTLWGKFLYIIVFMLWIPVITYVTLNDKYMRVIDRAIDKVIHIFRIYKE